ncbi:hypothetical protein CLIB1444_01S09208 [[Candida] jaroonii]|uniref:Uncharacterized protein n=1 Tax=[Candida] jaroonii TaxID=467808 RepID=A0ACA9Y0T2_9ASCO|nr:hypothetical protein CLIB1444_01S09208 [[Candida] jaroonii]
MEYLTKLNGNTATKSAFDLKYTFPVKYYDFHIYYYAHNQSSLAESNALQQRFLNDFSNEGEDGSVIVKKLPNEKVIGPHPTQFWEVDVLRPEVFIKVISWFQLNHGNLSVLIHPQTGDDILDHTGRAMWLGDKLPLLLDVFDDSTGIPEFGVKGGKRIDAKDYY